MADLRDEGQGVHFMNTTYSIKIPSADHNAELLQELVDPARQKPRYGYRRLHALVTRRGFAGSAQRG